MGVLKSQLYVAHIGGMTGEAYQYVNQETLKAIVCPSCNLPHNPEFEVVRRKGVEQYCFGCCEWFDIEFQKELT